ncbi:NAD(P)/FAD-dependent oxidoreductase [Methylococcus sp. EFPC2]|uniref:NAD(P)/FAD-dependent oxidoreductase n=1 Tax=Methylococcus sp. EFPC2 TaxID=2812648 RepID=UPI001966E629|nr:FAD-dependent oxidoreductase [Methylococcus sp. EFPC2]QSA97690.1 FAD-dependent oxidoreductase [Methylococcus sp. EFPC2]
MHTVIVGSGIAGISFAEELRKRSPETAVTLVSRETDGYYSRPLLSHAFTRADIETRIVLRTFDDLAQSAGIEVLSGTEALALDARAQTLACEKDGKALHLDYDKLILAQGSDAFVPPPFRAQANLFHVLNSLTDLKALRHLRDEHRSRVAQVRWAVVGGGLIGCEISADLAGSGDQVSLFHALPRLMERQLVEEDSAELLRLLTEHYRIDVRLNCAVQGFSGQPGALTVGVDEKLESGFHGIILACGFKPRIELAASAGLDTGRGIRVDGALKTSNPNIHAIGDVAELPDGKLYAYVTPVRSQAIWLARYLTGSDEASWQPPAFKPKAKIPGFNAKHDYLF